MIDFKKYKNHPLSLLLNILVKLSIVITLSILFIIIGYVLIKGIPNIKPSLFAWNYTSDNVSMMPAIINTISLTFLSLVFAVPFGVFSAIYLNEYAKSENKFVRLVRTTTETLAGIPSIVYGLFGYLVFVVAMKFSYSILAGALTLAIMILPTIMRTTEEAIQSVPVSYREASFGLGAGKLRTIVRVILPSAVPGIFAGIILGIGRIVGETAALMYTSGTVTGVAKSVFSSGRTLSVHMYALLSEGLHTNEAYATAVVLMAVVLLINWLSDVVAKKLTANGGGKNE